MVRRAGDTIAAPRAGPEGLDTGTPFYHIYSHEPPPFPEPSYLLLTLFVPGPQCFLMKSTINIGVCNQSVSANTLQGSPVPPVSKQAV
jgi:hypothetical protein